MILHVGLHKTGTTAIQSAFAANTSALRDHGALYPASGRGPGAEAHHNIAWQVGGDRRFQPDGGTLDDVAAELDRFSGTAMLSSEDFESILGRPKLLRSLIHHDAFRGRAVTILIYLREQAGYAESLFTQMQHHGMTHDATQFLDAILANGEVHFMGWRFHFDYLSLHHRMAWAGVERLIIRPYAAVLGQSSVSDALDVVAPGIVPPLPDCHLNQRSELIHTLAQFCARNIAGDSDAAPRIAALLGPALSQRAACLSTRRRRQFRKRFSPGNARLAHAFRLAGSSLDWSDSPPAGSLDMEALFSRRTAAILGQWLQNALDAKQALAQLLAQSIIRY